MLEKIKSKYIFKIIVSNLIFRRKLQLFKTNNKIKNLLKIDLIDYKILSGRYIEGKKNGYSKEYDSFNDALVFEGEYIEGKKFGYGKEYIDSHISYEGTYLNGKRNGKGVEYYSNGKIKFKGIFLLGVKYNGYGYDNKGKIIYEIKDGKGYIKELDEYDYCIFEGEYPNGKGKEYYYYFYSGKNIKFEGEYINGIKWNGKGYDNHGHLVYELKNGKGYVKEYKFFKLIFEGEYIDGIRNGKGKEYNFEGDLIFEGEYRNNYKKKGKAYIKGKLEFEGEYLCDKKWTGKTYDENGKIVYTINNGKGKAREYFKDSLIFEGEYINGKRHGKGKEYLYDKLKYEGEFCGKNIIKGKENDFEGYLNFKRGFFPEKWCKGESKEYIEDNKKGSFIQLFLECLPVKGKSKEKCEENNEKLLLFEGKFYNGKKWNGKEIEYERTLDQKYVVKYKYKIIKGKRFKSFKNKSKEN